jgi:hypothetical protein
MGVIGFKNQLATAANILKRHNAGFGKQGQGFFKNTPFGKGDSNRLIHR